MRHGPSGAQRLLRFLHVGQNHPAILEVLLSIMSEMDPAGRSVQKGHAQVVLECGKRAHHRRERDIEVRGRRREAAALNDGKRSFLRTYAVERGDGMRCPP